MQIPNIRIGQGIDVHQFVPDRPLILGGVTIPAAFGLKGHSDADALLHAITDAILGALGQGDIGTHFPDSDPAWKDADSAQLLTSVVEIMKKDAWSVVNVDSTIVAEQPRINPYVKEMVSRISELLEISEACCNVKATTCEQMGFLGRKEGLMAMAVVLLQRS